MKTRDESLADIVRSIEEQEDLSKQAWADNQFFLDAVKEEDDHQDRIESMVLAGLSRIEAATRDSGTIVALAIMAFVTQDEDSEAPTVPPN